MFWDEELKTLCRVPGRSKFRDAGIELDETVRKECYVAHFADRPRTRAGAVEAFFRSTFEAWTNYNRSGHECAYVGYNPVQCLDAEKIFADFPIGHVVHVVRNPYSGFADTSKRPFPLSLERYTWTWSYCQLLALTYAGRYPRNFHILRFEDLVANPAAAMTNLCDRLGLSASDKCLYPSFNGTKLEEVYPWGTIRLPTTTANLATADELTSAQKQEIKSLAGVMMKLLGYDDFG